MRFVLIISQLSVAVMFVFVAAVAVGEDAAPVANVGSAKRLIWDKSLMDKVDGIRFEMHRPHRTGERCLV